MSTATLTRSAAVTTTPTDGRGTFRFEIAAFETDSDNDRIVEYANVGHRAATVVDLDYAHVASLGGGADPAAEKIGTASVIRTKGSGGPETDLLVGDCQLDLGNPVATMVYGRLLADAADPMYLGEVSVFFNYDGDRVYEGPDGERVISKAGLLSVAIVRQGAQRTRIVDVKERKRGIANPDADVKDRLIRAQLDVLEGRATAPMGRAGLRLHLLEHRTPTAEDISINELRRLHRRLHAAGDAGHEHETLEERVEAEYVAANVPAKSTAEYVDELNRIEARAIVDEVRRAAADDDEVGDWAAVQKTSRHLGGNP